MDRGKLLTTSFAKATLGAGPFLGEIAWQRMGAPGRESFEPLQHLGNIGMGMGGTVMTAVMMEAVMLRRGLGPISE